MPFATVNNTSLHYATAGAPGNPCVVLSNSLGTDLRMWASQAAALAPSYYVVRYDTRGHGGSGTGTTPVTLDQLGQDVLALLDHLHVERAHFCGISMGGLTGQWLGVAAPQRIDKLVLANTAARIGSAEGWSSRAAQVRQSGMDAIADGAAGRWFTPGFIERSPSIVSAMINVLRRQDAAGYAACCDALAGADLRELVQTIPNRTLVIAGKDDPVTTVADADWLAAQLPDARVAAVPASHLSNLEAEQQFNQLLLDFLGS